MGYPGEHLGPTDEAFDGHSPAHAETVRLVGYRRHRSFHDGAAAGQHLETLVPRAGPARERIGRVADRVEAQGAVALDGLGHVGQLTFEDLAVAAQEDVG